MMRNDYQTKKFLVTGAHGQLGKEFTRHFTNYKINHYAPDESKLDICNDEDMFKIIKEYKPDYLLNCAAYNLVEDAENNAEVAFKVNANAVKSLAKLARENNVFLIHYSSDYVFDGKKGEPYVETDRPNPLNIYGQSKLEGEENIKQASDNFLIFRLSWVIGDGNQNFLYKLSQWAEKTETIKITKDEISVPTFTFDIVHYTLMSLNRNLHGLYHLVSSGYASRYTLAQSYLEQKCLKNTLIPVSANTFHSQVSRPRFSAMSNQKLSQSLGASIPIWENSLNKYLMQQEKSQ